MISGHDALRAAYVNWRIEPLSRITLRGDRLDFGINRYNITHASINSGDPVSDDFYDSGGRRLLWGDQAIDANGAILAICNVTTWDATASNLWISAVGSGECASMEGDDPVLEVHTRPGLTNISAGNFRAFYILGNDKLAYTDISLSGEVATWGSSCPSLAALPAFLSTSGLAVAPVGATSCFVGGYSPPIFWLQYANYTEGAWALGAVRIIHSHSDMTWQDGLWIDAEPMPGDATKYILTIPTGDDGECQAIIYDSTTDTYSVPFFVLATPGSDFLRRVWISGLSTINGRVWGVVQNDVGDGQNTFYASHIGLVSTLDGKSWRDEGFVSIHDVRGKLFTYNDVAYIVSCTSHLSGTSCYRLGDDVASRKHVAAGANMFSLEHPGVGSVPQLTVQLSNEDLTIVEPGMQVDLEVSANGVDDYLTVFSGYLDQPALTLGVGKESNQWLARGRLARLIGETAYTPLTTLEWRGSQNFYTNFQSNGTAVMSLALYDDEGGYWTAERNQDGSFSLRAQATGTALVPQRWYSPYIIASMDVQTWRDACFVFGIADDETYDINYFQAGMISSRLRIQKVVGTIATSLAEQTYTDYYANQPVTLKLAISPGKIQLWREYGADPTTWQTVSYSGWDANGTQVTALPSQQTVGVMTTIDKTYYEGEEANFSEVWVHDGGYPSTLAETLIALGDISGVTVTASSREYAADWPLVSSFDALVTLPSSGDGLYLFDNIPTGTGGQLLQFYASYMKLAVGAGYEYCPFLETLTFPCDVRIIAYGNFVAAYRNDRMLGAIHCNSPNSAYYVHGTSGVSYVMWQLYQPLQVGNSQWIAWDAGQPATSVLQNLLDHRRVYFTELGTGIVRLFNSPETGDVLIDSLHAVNGQTYYRMNVSELNSSQDLRNYVAVLGVVDTEGNRAYLLDTQAAPYTRRCMLSDSSRANTTAEALTEGQYLQRDSRKEVDRRQVVGFWDPAMEPGDRFALSDWTGVVASYSVNTSMENNKIAHQAIIQAQKYISPDTVSQWDAAIWNQFKWG